MTVADTIIFRRSLCAYLLWYYLSLSSSAFDMWGRNQFIDYEYLPPGLPSIFHYLSSSEGIYFSLAIMSSIICLLIFKPKFWFGWVALFTLNLSFHNINPLIIHEPQQLASLYLLCIIIGSEAKERDYYLIQSLRIFVVAYYFIAGLKKLPDPAWLNGNALENLLSWDGITKSNFLVKWLQTNSRLCQLATWATLAFELLSPIGFLWARLRPCFLFIGVVFHSAIAAILDVGTFSAIFFASYALFLDSKTRETIKGWIRLRGPLRNEP